MKRPTHLSDLRDFRKRQEMTEILRRETVANRRVRVKAIGRHIDAAAWVQSFAEAIQLDPDCARNRREAV